MAVTAAERQRRYREKRDADPQQRAKWLSYQKTKYQKDKLQGKKKLVNPRRTVHFSILFLRRVQFYTHGLQRRNPVDYTDSYVLCVFAPIVYKDGILLIIPIPTSCAFFHP